MIDAVARWVSRGVSLAILGPVAAMAAGMVRAGDGSADTTLLTGAGLVSGLVAVLSVGACVIVAGGLAGRLADRHEAVLNAGFVLGWVAWTSGRLGEVYRLSPSAGTLARLALEGAVMAAVVLASLVVADRLSRRSGESEGLSLGPADMARALRLKAGVPVFVVSLAIGVVFAWLFARHDRPGQALGAAFLGGVGAGVFGSLVFQSVMKDEKHGLPGVTATFVPVVLGLLAAGVVGPAVGLVMPGAGSLTRDLARGVLPGWVLVSPAAWGAGALIGVPAGISFLHPKAALDASGLPHPGVSGSGS